MIIKNAKFVTSVADAKSLYNTEASEIAIAGKSNVGKSSFINYICNNGKLARTSGDPGRTRLLNYFEVNGGEFFFVDLPGYGYAKVSQQEKDRWGKLMENYFAAQRIDLGVMIVDARHAPTNNDITMANWFLESGCPFVVVANKLDKLKKSELIPNMERIRQDLELPEACPVIPFSAEKGTGREELVRLILEAIKE